jgi:UDP-N-acetyl-D-glucosamine dehydrogenase
MTFSLAVIGQGYVGLPLAVRAANSGISTVGIDVDARWIEKILRNSEVIEQVESTDLKKAQESGYYVVSTDFNLVSQVNVVAICVPTPIDPTNSPDLSYLQEAIAKFAPTLKPGTLVILESTSFPGTMREVVIPQVLQTSGLYPGQIHFAFSPERLDPGNTMWDVHNTPKIVSGATTLDLELATKFYSSFMENVVPVNSLEVAEMAKLLENTYRQINISFINEFAQQCQTIGVSVWDVIDAAATKPFGFTRFNPGLGIGGHCIPVDPHFLNWKLHQFGQKSEFIELASKVNHNMPKFIADRALKLVADSEKAISCLVVGLSYKPNVADLRESPSIELINILRSQGVDTCWHDAMITEWNSEKSAPLNGSFDLVILVHEHGNEVLSELFNRDTPIFDCTGKYRNQKNVSTL